MDSLLYKRSNTCQILSGVMVLEPSVAGLLPETKLLPEEIKPTNSLNELKTSRKKPVLGRLFRKDVSFLRLCKLSIIKNESSK